MTDLSFADLPYHEDSALLFDKIADEPWSVFIDSGLTPRIQGRYDILAARPEVCITTQDRKTKIQTYSQSYTVPDSPFTVLGELLPNSRQSIPDLPFAGGAIGFFSYDLCRYMEKIPEIAKDDVGVPDMVMGIYSWMVVVDHKKKRAVPLHGKDSRNCKR